jgi:hypothetical protein
VRHDESPRERRRLPRVGRDAGERAGVRRMTVDELLVQLRGSKTDLGRFVETMVRNQLPYLVVPASAVRAWQETEPQTWAMVCDWLAEHGKSVVQV